MYGRSVRIITAIAGTIGAAGAIAVQFKVFGNLVGYFTNISAEVAIIVSGCVVTLYSAFGGIRAVTLTDIFQIFVFGVALPIIGIVIWNQLYLDNFLVSEFFQNASASHAKFKLSEVLNIGNPRFWQMIPLVIYFMVPSMFPAIYQRMIMAKNIDQIKKTCLISAILLLAINLGISWIPFLIFNVDPDVVPGHLPGYIINNYTYIGLKGLILVGVIAMAMSTADSNINISSVFFAHDICAPLNIGRNRELLLSKIFSIALGISAIGLALKGGDLFSIILLANSFYMPVVTVPLLISILGFRSSTLSVLISMAAGFCTVVIWRIIGIKTDPIAFAMLMNIVFLFGSHYLLKQPGGWVAGKKEQTEQMKIAKESRWRKLVEFNFIEVCKKHSPTNEMSYTGMGIYFIMYTITTMYTTYAALSGLHGQLILGIYQFMMVTGVVLAMYPIWPFSEYKKIKQTIAQIIWPVVIFVMFVFFNSFFVLISEFNPLQFSVFSINMIITAMLFGWRAGLGVIVVGSYAAVFVHNALYPGYAVNTNIGSPGFVVIYIMMMVGSVFLIFVKPKQEQLAVTKAKAEYLGHEVTDLSKRVTHYNERISNQQQEIERLGATAQKILNNVNHELRLPVGNVMNFAEMLNEGLENYSKDQLKMLSDEVYKNSNRLSSMILNMLDLATLDVKKVNLAKKTVNLSELIEDRVKSCRKIYLQGKRIDFEISIEPEMLALVDANYIR